MKVITITEGHLTKAKWADWCRKALRWQRWKQSRLEQGWQMARGMASAPQSSALSGSGNEFGTTAQCCSARKIIRTAQITIETESVEEICGRIEMLAASFGGYVQQSSINRNSGASDSNERLSGSVQIAVPSEMFDQVLTQLPSLGKVLHKNVSGQDVTEEYVDLEARLKNWRAQEDQLNLIMTKAHNVEEILAVKTNWPRCVTKSVCLAGCIT